MTTLEKMNNKARIILYSLVFLGMYILLQGRYAYYLFFLEQNQLFLSGKDYLQELLQQPGGLAQYIAEYVIQFFVFPHIGALCTALLITGVIVLTSYLLKKMNQISRPVFLFEVSIAFFLLLNILDSFFHYKGLIGYLFCLISLIVYKRIKIKNFAIRLLLGGVLALVLFFIASPFYVVFVISACCIELKEEGFSRGKSFLLLLLTGVICAILYIGGMIVFPRLCFSPDGLYASGLTAGWIFYMPWGLLVAAILFNEQVSKALSCIKNTYVTGIIQGVVLISLICILLPRYDNYQLLPLRQLNHFATHEKWDRILSYCKEHEIKDNLCLNYQNLALAEQNILADSLLYYPQDGKEGLFGKWSKTFETALVLQEICFRYGDLASARRYAFEGNVGASGKGYPQTLKMLVRTNLLYGEFRIAEKYIHYFRHTFSYKEWADEQSEKLYAPLPQSEEESYLVVQNNIFKLAERDSSNKRLNDFVLCTYLLGKDLEGFIKALPSFYSAENCSEYPILYQEAIMAYAQTNSDILNQYQVSDSVKNEFDRYISIYSSAKTPEEQKEWTSLYHAHSYWFYYHQQNKDS